MRIWMAFTAQENKKSKENSEKIWWSRKKCVPLHPLRKRDAPVAQLVEHLTLNQGVQGSSPCGCTKGGKRPPLFFEMMMHP